MRMRISGQDIDFLIFADADLDVDFYFQYVRMRMLKVMRISADVDGNADILSTFKYVF